MAWEQRASHSGEGLAAVADCVLELGWHLGKRAHVACGDKNGVVSKSIAAGRQQSDMAFDHPLKKPQILLLVCQGDDASEARAALGERHAFQAGEQNLEIFRVAGGRTRETGGVHARLALESIHLESRIIGCHPSPLSERQSCEGFYLSVFAKGRAGLFDRRRLGRQGEHFKRWPEDGSSFGDFAGVASGKKQADRHFTNLQSRRGLRQAALAVAGFLAAAWAAAAWEPGMVAALIEASESAAGIPFGQIVQDATGYEVFAVDPVRDGPWLQRLGRALDDVLAALNDPHHPIHTAGRINEASRFIEEALAARLNAEKGWTCEFAPTVSGMAQRTGYPDLRLELEDGSLVFLDPKLHAASARGSSLRTFYYEPRKETSKITGPGRHLLVGIMHETRPNGGMVFSRWELVDIAAMPIRLKIEFQASNRDIYRPEAIVLQGPGAPDG